MELQLPTAVVAAAAPKAAAAVTKAAGPSSTAATSYASQNQQQHLKLAIQRQQQEEERKQQRPKQQKLGQHAQQQLHVEHRDEQWQSTEHQRPQQEKLQHLQEEQLLKIVHLRTKGTTTMQESNGTLVAALGSGSVSTANSSSESSSRTASDDEGKVNQTRGIRNKRVGGGSYKEYRTCEIPNLPLPHQHTQQTLEQVYKQSGQQFEEYSQQSRWQQQQQHQRSLQHEQQQQQQQFELQQRFVQGSQQPYHQQQQQRIVQEDHPSQQQQQQQKLLRSYAEAAALGTTHLTPYTEEGNLAIDVGGPGFINDGLPPQTTTVSSTSSLPLFPSRFAFAAADVPSAAPDLYNILCGNGHVGGLPVRPARKKVVSSTLPRCPTTTVSSSSGSTTAIAKEGARPNAASRMYRNSRITEVKSFAGTLEEYLLFRRQQAEREEAAAAARSRNSCSRVATAAGADHELLPERKKKAATPSAGSRGAASTGQHFIDNAAAIRSSKSSSRATSAGRWSRNAGDVGTEEDLSAVSGNKAGSLQSRWKEHLQQFFAWKRNAGVKQQTRRPPHEKFQQLLSRQASQDSQQDGSGKSMISALNLAGGGARDGLLPALSRPNVARKDKPQSQLLRMSSGGGNSFPVSRAADEEVAGEEKAGMAASSGPLLHRRRDISRSPAGPNKLDGTSERIIGGDTHTLDSAESPNAQQQQVNCGDAGRLADNNQERRGREATGKDVKNSTHKADAEKTGAKGKERKFIPLEMKNGEIVWPTDRPVIPLNAWIFQNFSADEPLEPKNWVHLPNVGPAISPPVIPIPPAQQQNVCSPPSRPPIRCSTAPLLHSPPSFAEIPLTGPVKLPPIKLPVGCEVDPFTIYGEMRPDISTLTNIPHDSSYPGVLATGEKRRSRSLNARLAGTPLAKHQSVHTQFVKKSCVKHRPTNFMGVVVRAEDAGRVLLVRSKEGQLRKLPRDECESIGFTCASMHPPGRALNDAAHHSRGLLSETVETTSKLVPENKASALSSCPSSKLPPLPRADHRRQQRTQRETRTQQHSSNRHALQKAALPRSASVPRHRSQAFNAFLDIFGSSRESAALLSPVPTQNEDAGTNADNGQIQQPHLQHVPDVQQVLKLAQQHATATTHNTVALRNMATVPSIRAVDSQVTVEAIRVKKYTLEGKDEENFVPVFSGGVSQKNAKASSSTAAAFPVTAMHSKPEIVQDAAQLLLQKHEAREDMKKREKELMAEEVIYAQDAPEATRASGIAPPTIVKETLVIPPREDELLHYIWKAPGIVPPLNQGIKPANNPRRIGAAEPAQPVGCDRSSISTEDPNMQPVNGDDYRSSGGETDRTAVGSVLQLQDEGPAWFTDLKAQFRRQLMHQYQQTGSMEAAALAVSSGGYSPLFFTAAGSSAVQRKQAKVLRDELREMDFAPMEPSSPLQTLN